MAKMLWCLATLSLLVGAVRTADAGGVLVTPVIPSGITGASMELCQVLNVGKKPAEVTIDIVNAGNAETLVRFGPMTIYPGMLQKSYGFFGNSDTYCRTNGLSPQKGKATFMAIDDDEHILMTVTAP